MKELTIEEKAKAYDEAIERAKKWRNTPNIDKIPTFGNRVIEEIFPELKESEDEKIREVLINMFRGYDIQKVGDFTDKEIIAWLEKQGETFTKKDVDDAYLKGISDAKQELEKQCEQKPAENLIETWKDMRLEVYQQASGNRHEPNCSDDTTKMFSLNDIDEIVEKMSEQKPIDKVEPKFRIGDFVKNTNYQGEPIYEIVYRDKECYICEYRGKENMGDKTVMHFAFDNPYLRLVEQKLAWSEKDEDYINDLIKYFSQNERLKNTKEDIVIWLKSLRPQS